MQNGASRVKDAKKKHQERRRNERYGRSVQWRFLKLSGDVQQALTLRRLLEQWRYSNKTSRWRILAGVDKNYGQNFIGINQGLSRLEFSTLNPRRYEPTGS